MKYILTILILTISHWIYGQSNNDSLNWETIVKTSNWTILKSVKEFDSILISKFSYWKEMSDPKGKFNATDFGGGPKRRLYFAATFGSYWIVSYEHGGRGYGTDCFFIWIKNKNEIVVYHSEKEFNTMEKLKSFAFSQSIPLEKWNGEY